MVFVGTKPIQNEDNGQKNGKTQRIEKHTIIMVYSLPNCAPRKGNLNDWYWLVKTKIPYCMVYLKFLNWFK